MRWWSLFVLFFGNLQAEKILAVKAAEAEAEAKHLSGPQPYTVNPKPYTLNPKP